MYNAQMVIPNAQAKNCNGGNDVDKVDNLEFQPAKTYRASEVIYDQIYQKIVDGKLQSGSRLPSERELAAQFGRSRPCVREALRMLQQDGLISINVGSAGGAVVQEVSMNTAEVPLQKLVDIGVISIDEIIDYRTYNDRCCAFLAAQHRTDEDIERLREIISRYNEYVSDSAALANIDFEFHQALAAASHNKLCILVSDIITRRGTSYFWDLAGDKLSEERVLAVNRLAYENHKGIFEAVVNRDVDVLSQLTDAATKLYYDAVSSVS